MMKTPNGYQGIFEEAVDLGEGFHAITLRAKRGKERIRLRVKSEEVKPELLGHFVTLYVAAEELPL